MERHVCSMYMTSKNFKNEWSQSFPFSWDQKDTAWFSKNQDLIHFPKKKGKDCNTSYFLKMKGLFVTLWASKSWLCLDPYQNLREKNEIPCTKFQVPSGTFDHAPRAQTQLRPFLKKGKVLTCLQSSADVIKHPWRGLKLGIPSHFRPNSSLEFGIWYPKTFRYHLLSGSKFSSI